MEKTCSKCKQTKPLSEFYSQRGTCKACLIKRVLKWKEKNPDKVARSDARFRATPKRKRYARTWQAKHRENAVSHVTRYRKRHPLKAQAHSLVTAALKAGKLHKLPCAVCGALNTQAHHADYNKPLEVEWLCRRHHRERHAKAL